MTGQLPPFYNMPAPQRAIMEFIVRNIQEKGESPTIQEIADETGREPPNVLKTLRVMERRGFIKREERAVRGITLNQVQS